MTDKPIFFTPSTIETIDFAFHRWFDKELNIFCDTIDGFRKVPIVWVAGERSAQIKKNPDLRDSESALILPRISLERKDFEKDPSFRNHVVAHLPPNSDYKGNSFASFKIINQPKTSNFSNNQAKRTHTANNVGPGQLNFKTKKQHPIVYTTYYMPQPTYMRIVYEVNIKTEYQQQMNQIMQPILTFAGHVTDFFIEYDNHRFECLFEPNFAQDNNIGNLGEEERKFESKFSIRCLGYLMGGDKNQKYPNFTKRENAVQFSIGRERTVLNPELV